MGNSNSEVIVAAVALVISVVALTATFMQVLQQYYASARGYTQCNEKVMGGWAESKSRRFTWDELRFEVEFDSPVIFVSPPSNKRGPVPDQDIYFLDGTPKSLKDTHSVKDMDPRIEWEQKSTKERVHTADNERASWFILMYAIQRMEAESSKWQNEQYSSLGPPPDGLSKRYRVPEEPPSLLKHHTLTVAVQKKRKSWDTMPTSMTKPYATSTMCHLIEIMAVLGVYWKEFNRTHDRYRAEGNGFVVLGERVSDLGLTFSFNVYGKCEFKRTRVIPVDEVKQLAFGCVPTIYRETLDQRRLGTRNDEPMSLRTLSMAGRREIGETLVLIGCNNNTVRYFLDDGKRTSHLFPMSFEILGMLSRTLHIDNSTFTYIPNPTPDRFDRKALSLVKIMESYQKFVQFDLADGAARNPVILKRIKHHANVILGYQNETKPVDKLLGLKALHIALDDMDEVLTAKSKEALIADAGRPSVAQGDRVAEVLPGDNPQVDRQEHRREVVQDVLRSHIQEVMRLLNGSEERVSETWLRPDMPAPSSPAGSRFQVQHFEDMDAASPDDRQDKFMEVYFEVIRRRVVPHATTSTTHRRNSTDRRMSVAVGNAPPGFGFKRHGTGRTFASGRAGDESSPLSPAHNGPPLPLRVDTGDGLQDSTSNSVVVVDDDATAAVPDPEDSASLADQDDVKHDDIWCTLVFRMICWLMLHDFDKDDIQINKSELMGSRMPVFIA